MARLRLGTVGFNGYLFQVRVERNPDCGECAEFDYVNHYFLEYSRFAVQRKPMGQVALHIHPDGVTSDLLLCAFSFQLKHAKQQKLVLAVGCFIRDTARFPGCPPGSDVSL